MSALDVLPGGERALLIATDGAAQARAVAAAVRAQPHLEVQDVVPAARTVLVTVAEPRALPALREALAGLEVDPEAREEPRRLTLEVVYDGEDLHDVADAAGMSVQEVVRRHTAGEYVVEFIGFAPGFAYLTGLDEALHLPRLATPRTSVPAGSVAIAGPYAAVYPRSSPGGWRLLGHCDAVLFDADADPPTPWRAGTRVRFTP